MKQILLSLSLALALVGCSEGDSSPTSPTAPQWSLSGAVTRSTGEAVAGATLEVLDGPNRGQRTTTDAAGGYRFAALEQAGFSVRASAPDYEPGTKGVGLTANAVLDFTLQKVLKALLVFEGSAEGVRQRDGTYAIPFSGVNQGDGCAGSIAGVTSFSSTSSGEPLLFREWGLPATMIVSPGARFEYRVCCLTLKEATANPFYTTQFTFATVACP